MKLPTQDLTAFAVALETRLLQKIVWTSGAFFFGGKKMTRCSRAIKQIDFCNSQAISAFKAGKISEAEIWHDMAERKQAELDGMTLSECRQGAWA